MLFVADLARYLRFSITTCTLLVALLPRLAVAQDAENAWDFDPYRVLVWIVDPNRKEVAAGLETPLRNYLDYDFSAVWRVDIQDAPAVARVAAIRDLQSLDYDQLTSADPVLAVRKDHPDAPRIRSPEDVGEKIKRVFATPDFVEGILPRGAAITIRPSRDIWERLMVEGFTAADLDPGDWGRPIKAVLQNLQDTDDVDVDVLREMLAPVTADEELQSENPTEFKRRQAAMETLLETLRQASYSDNSQLHGVKPRLFTEGFETQDQVFASWAKEATEALLLPRGLAVQLETPDKKIFPLEIDGLMGEVFGNYDKIFVVRIDSSAVPLEVSVMEIDCLMRLQGPIVTQSVLSQDRLVDSIGAGITRAFAPTVRVEDAATNTVTGRVRAAGLIIDPRSPAAIQKDDFLQPAIRKNDRSGNPIILEALDWAYLHVSEVDGPKLKMKLHAGRMGGLQGSKNRRTHRLAFRIRPYYPNTVIRLHAQKEPDEPLQGYELYEKELNGSAFTFVGRTDWDGRFVLEKSDQPMRLLYVKNGGAVLAKLPCVPGQDPLATADIRGDDMRLQAEAYIRGVQNAIIDLVALRKLLAARIRMRLEKGKIEEARELLEALREQPTYEILSTDMRKKRTAMQSDVNQQVAMINQLFDQTRTMLVKHINEQIIRELEADVANVEAGNPYVPRGEEGEEEEEATTSQPAAPAENRPAAAPADA